MCHDFLKISSMLCTSMENINLGEFILPRLNKFLSWKNQIFTNHKHKCFIDTKALKSRGLPLKPNIQATITKSPKTIRYCPSIKQKTLASPVTEVFSKTLYTYYPGDTCLYKDYPLCYKIFIIKKCLNPNSQLYERTSST